MVTQKLPSRIDKVKIYASGATITRIAQLNLTTAELPTQVEIGELPLALDDNSVRVRVESEQGNAPIASDIRIGLAVPPVGETPNYSPDEELRRAEIEVAKIEDIIDLIDHEIDVLNQLEVPARPDSDIGVAPPPSPLGARLALANFSDEQIRLRIQEKRENLEKLAKAEENLDDLEQQKAIASTARNAKPEELRKTVTVSLSYENESPDLNQTIQLFIEYFVPGARWIPTYVCRLNSAENQATIAVRALICQRTGEDWSSVRLELCTAKPNRWCGIPELPSLRLGKAQQEIRKVGWRKPPVGAEILFEDFDRQKESATATVSIPYISIKKEEKVQNYQKKAQEIRLFDELESFLEKPQENQDDFLKFSDDSDWEDLEKPMSRKEAQKKRKTSQNIEKIHAESYDMQRFSSLSSGRLNKIFSNSDLVNNWFTYGIMRIGAYDDVIKRGKLSIESQGEAYLKPLKQQQVVVNFDIWRVVKQAQSNARECYSLPLPPGGIEVEEASGSFDYFYNADGRIDIPSDGQFHSVALTSKTTDVDVRYVVVPREDTNVFRIAQLRNPLTAPLLSGPADVYIDGEYILSTNIVTVPSQGQMELGLGVEQAIKVVRNTSYSEARSSETIVAFNEFRHQIKIEIINYLSRNAKIEVRERLPIPKEGAKVEVQIEQVSPAWEQYQQQERETPIKGGYLWHLEIAAKEQKSLSVDYKIKTFVDHEVIGGNRRE